MRKKLLSILALLCMTVVGAWAKTINLSALTEQTENVVEVTVENGDVLTGTLNGKTQCYKILIEADAEVTLSNVTINAAGISYYSWAGITCLGDATIILEDETVNTVNSLSIDYPGIQAGPSGKTLIIKGEGTLNVKGCTDGAGIGGGDGISCGNIKIEGGNINAEGKIYCPGIGSGCNGSSCGDITISGGTVNASSYNYGAGIGSGADSRGDSPCNCGTITISGGEVTATGGLNQGPGIGSGWRSQCSNIIICGGDVTATGGKTAAGIGSAGAGKTDTPSPVGSCGNITINGGTVTATGGGLGGTFSNGGKGGSGIGGGYAGNCGNIKITKGVTSVTATKGTDANNSIGAGNSGSCGTVTIGGTTNPTDISNTQYTYNGDGTGLGLSEDNDNTTLITTLTTNGQKAYVTLMRTLQAGGWNTFCVPFNMTLEDFKTAINDDDVKVKELTGSSFDSSKDELSLTFGDATSIVAGTPYLVKVTSEVVNPTFDDVTISNSTTTKTTTYANFVPVMSPTPLTGGDKSILFVTGGNSLTYPSADGDINGFRAYFQLHDAALQGARAYTMSFDDGETTGIQTLDNLTISPMGNSVYDLQGRRIEGQPTQSGVYIVNGKKIVIK